MNTNLSRVSYILGDEKTGRLSTGMKILLSLVAIALGVAVVRYFWGLGAATNLNDAYPWGIWIGFDVLCGVALAAGGFALAATVYIFRLDKYHAVVRPAVLTALLGYTLVVVALLVDLGFYYRIWHPMVMWQHTSAMFEVGWCVMIYTVVLFLEFLPAIFDRFGLADIRAKARAYTSPVIVGLLTLFSAALSHSVAWTLAVFVVMGGLYMMVRRGVLREDPNAPMLLIIAGVILSTLHQSSLGTLFLIVPHKLSALWYTPILPLQFFVSAVFVGLAMVIFESTVSSKVFRKPLEKDILVGLGKALPYILTLYLLMKVGDIVARGAVGEAFTMSTQAIMFWAEILIGVVLPLALLMSSEISRSSSGLFWSALFVIVGVVLNRLNVTIIGLRVQSWQTYFPSWMEFAISIGIVSAGLIVFSVAARQLPIYEEATEHHVREIIPSEAAMAKE
jgi:Ni/Fe-hydrogenase subunit HybB-like protein